MRYPMQVATMGGVLGGVNLSRDEVRAKMALLPPIDPTEVALAVSFADLVRDDYAEAALEVIDATDAGRKAKLLRYGVGFGVGALGGALVMYLARSKRSK